MRQQKAKLLKLLPRFSPAVSDSEHIAKLIGDLERQAPTLPHGEALFDEIAGDWELLFSSARASQARSVRITSISQSLRDNTLINYVRFAWRPWRPDYDPVELAGTLRVTCHSATTAGARMRVTLQRRSVVFDDRADGAQPALPADMVPMLADLRRALPDAVYDPAGAVEATFVDADLRVACRLSPHAGARFVYARATSSVTAPARPARVELLRLLPALINDPKQAARVHELLSAARREASLPRVAALAELALTGRWRLLFSSAPPLRGGRGSVRVRALIQTVTGRRLINTIACVWSGAPAGVPLAATMQVLCEYEFVGARRIRVVLKKHTLQFDKRADGLHRELPKDLAPMLGDLRCAVPVDFFDPSGLAEIVVMDDDFRVVRYLGKRLAGVQNVFVGVHTLTPFPRE